MAAIFELAGEITREFGAIYGHANNSDLGASEQLVARSAPANEALVRLNTLSAALMSKYVVRSAIEKKRARVIDVPSGIAVEGALRIPLTPSRADRATRRINWLVRSSSQL
jgi:short-subunit dehydrogenase involved in D-alanine esterification of teichoic acids